MMTVRCFLLLTRWPATLAPATRGAPTVTAAPVPTIRTWSKGTTSPGSPTSFSTFTTSLAATLYCLPPVLITAKFIVTPAHRPVLLRSRSVAPWRKATDFRGWTGAQQGLELRFDEKTKTRDGFPARAV